MQATFASLLTSRRFAPLFVTQFLGAFNDNLLKSALAVLVTYRLAPDAGYEPASLVMVAGALFIAPFFLLSGVAGTLADQVDKAVIARWVKAAEIGIMVTGAAGLLWEHVPLLLLTLFLLGTHSTVFGPIKYSLLPQHLASGELVAGNSLIEAGTFLAILLGTIVGSSAVSFAQGPLFVGVVGVACAALGWVSARAIPPAPPHVVGPLRVSMVRDTVAIVRLVTGRPAFLLPVLAISWFWLVGATVVSGLPVFAKDVLYADEHMVTVMLALFAAGVGLGSYLAERWLHGEVSARHVPVAAALMALSAIDLGAASSGRPATADLLGPVAFVQTAGGWRVLVDLLVLAAAGGLFTVPLYALLQHRSEPEVRSRVIAGNNVINAVAMTVAAVVAAAVLSRGMTMAELFALCGWGTVPVAIVAAWILRRDVVKTVVRTVLRLLYRVEVHGLDTARAAFPRAVVAANHASFLDGLLLGAFLPGDPVFAVDTFIARQWWARPFLVFVNAVPVDPTNPLSIRAMIRAVEGGAPCIIFPEGRITTTGSLMKVYEGPAVIAERTRAALVLARIDGLERTPFSRLAGAVRQQWFPKVRLHFVPPTRLTVPEGLAGRHRRAALRRALGDQMVRAAFETADLSSTLFGALLAAREIHGGGHVIIDDIDQQPMTYDRLVTSCFALGGALAARTRPDERVGVLLPTSRAAVVAFFALQAERRVPAMLNFSTGPANVQAACRAAEVKLVISSRRFIEQAKLDALAAGLASQVRIVYLEDLRSEIGMWSRVSARFRAARTRTQIGDANAPALVLFTSGSEGTPKGVVLSHRNLLANRNQLAAVVDFTPRDLVFNAMPVFHSFGLTGGLLLPLLSGVRTFLYPSPLHYRTVPELVYGLNATILFGTDTFLAGYARMADNYDFYSVRYVFAGAEKVKAETSRAWFDKFGIRILEGYGATETAPALAVNTAMHYRAGSVGRFLPGIEHRLEPVPGLAEGQRLFVRGPNVMLGYLRAERPGVLEPPPDGWYDTGDIVTLDEEGFVTVKGRAKRFAKVAGEMVPLGAVEDFVGRLWPEHMHAVVAAPDAKRGEQLVLVTDRKDGSRPALIAAARDEGLPEIFVPRAIVSVDAIPVLGNGKVDYVGVMSLAADLAGVS